MRNTLGNDGEMKAQDADLGSETLRDQKSWVLTM